MYRHPLAFSLLSRKTQVPYVDVCDDARLAVVAKGLQQKAQEAGVPATISAGIWPGVDQLMAVQARDNETSQDHLSCALQALP